MTHQLTTTLEDIRAASPCADGWGTLLDHLGKSGTEAKGDKTPLPILTVLESNGMDDALWVMDCAIGNKHICRLFAADCAEMVLPLFEREHPKDTRPRDAIAVARDAKAWSAARSAASEAAWFATSSAASEAARSAAWSAAWSDASEAAWFATSSAARSAARSAASEAARSAASEAAWFAIKARLIQYLTHGEAAKDMPWSEKIEFSQKETA